MDDIKILIVEDEPLIADDLNSTLQEQGFQTMTPVDCYEDAVQALKEGVDLVLVDIMIFGEKDGIQLGNYINQYVKIPYLYISSLSDKKTLEKIRSTGAAGYLVKPIDENELLLNIELALYKSRTNAINAKANYPESFFVKSKGKSIRINAKDILYIKAVDNYCTIHTDAASHVLSHNMKTVLNSLDPDLFQRVHKSHIVNIKEISHLEAGYINIHGHNIPIGRTYKDEFLAQIKYL